MLYSLTSENRHCPACGSGKVRHLDIFPHKREVEPGKFVWFISGCRTCGLVLIDPLPSEQQVENLYAPDGKWVKEKVEQFISEGVLSSEPNMSNDVGAAPAVWRAIDGLPIRTEACSISAAGAGAF
jgi:hypothetical protein